MASVASTYARALADVVFERKLKTEKALTDLQSLAELVSGNRELREVWQAPSVTMKEKHAVLDAIVARQKLSVEIRNFVAVLIDHERISFFGEIVKQFEKELNQRSGFVDAEIKTARDLMESERAAIEADISKLTGKKVRAQYFRDASLLGGVVVRVGSTIYDASVTGQLAKIRDRIASSY